jgi:hypothetical protein
MERKSRNRARRNRDTSAVLYFPSRRLYWDRNLFMKFLYSQHSNCSPLSYWIGFWEVSTYLIDLGDVGPVIHRGGRQDRVSECGQRECECLNQHKGGERFSLSEWHPIWIHTLDPGHACFIVKSTKRSSGCRNGSRT